MTSSRPPHTHRFSPSPSPSQHPYLSSTPPTSTSHTSTPQPPATTVAPVPPHSSTPQPQSTTQTLTPFFMLISNPGGTTHKHPVVHYVFDDDDIDPTSSASGKSQGPEQERVVVVDMKADGESVAAAHSLSDDWQVVGTDVGSAPQWMAGDEDGGSAGASGSGGGVMLTIRGLVVPKVGSMAAAATAPGGGGAGAGGGGKETLYELAEMYHDRMAEIKNVIEYAEKSASASASTSAEPEP